MKQETELDVSPLFIEWVAMRREGITTLSYVDYVESKGLEIKTVA